MDREPGIERRDATEAVDDHHDDLAWIASLPPCPGIPSTDEEVAQSIARARAQITAGRGVSGEAVAHWAAALGTADERPMPPEWLS